MSEPKWVPVRQILKMHDLSLEYFGGASGLRDEGLLHSAADRAPNKWHHGEQRLTLLAAAYAFGLSRYHAFVDGNKRVALAAMAEFLAKNGLTIVASPAELTETMLALATGNLTKESLANWLDANTTASPVDPESDIPKLVRRDHQ